jgi:hypothetical protein
MVKIRRRPNLSDNAPQIGEKMNCSKEYRVLSKPPKRTVFLKTVSPPIHSAAEFREPINVPAEPSVRI